MPNHSFIAMLTLFGLAGCGSTQSLVCPRPELYDGSGKITEAGTNPKAIQARFDRRFSANDLDETIALLRRRFPDADDDAIYNYLVAAYCPALARQGNPISVQKAKLLAFENAVHTVLGD